MGSLKEKYLSLQERHHTSLASALGLSWGQLDELDYEVAPSCSDDGLLYGYIVSFSDSCDPALLGMVEGLDENRQVQLSPWVFERYSDEDYELDAIAQSIDHESTFFFEMEASRKLQELSVEDHETRRILLRQVFISIVSALETYLSDSFITRTLASDVYLESFVSGHPELRKKKVSFSDIYIEYRNVKETAKNIMVSSIYHKLPVVKNMYESTFGIDFPDFSQLHSFVLTRHDLVHRSGKTTDGEFVSVNDKLVNELRDSAIRFVDELSRAIKDDDIPF